MTTRERVQSQKLTFCRGAKRGLEWGQALLGHMASWSCSKARCPTLSCSSLSTQLIPEHLQWLTGLQNPGQTPQHDSEPFPHRAPSHLSDRGPPCVLSTRSTCHSPKRLGLPCWEVTSNLVKQVVVPGSKMPQ